MERYRQIASLAFAASLVACATEPGVVDRRPDPELFQPLSPTRTSKAQRRVLPREPANRTAPASSQLTARFVTTDGARRRSFVFTRDADRVGVRDRLRMSEWQFLRNPVKPSQLTACSVDHARRQLVFYGYIDLIEAELPADWHQLTSCGVAPESLGQMARTDTTESAFGLVFTKYVPAAPDAVSDMPREVWWNDTHCVPLRIITERGGGEEMTQELVSMRLSTDANARLLLAQRFRPYDRQTATGYREQHAACGITPIMGGARSATDRRR